MLCGDRACSECAYTVCVCGCVFVCVRVRAVWYVCDVYVVCVRVRARLVVVVVYLLVCVRARVRVWCVVYSAVQHAM